MNDYAAYIVKANKKNFKDFIQLNCSEHLRAVYRRAWFDNKDFKKNAKLDINYLSNSPDKK